MVKEIAWTPNSFENQLIKVIKISAMLTLLFIFVVLINSTHQYNQNPDYNAAHPRFTKIDDNNYLNILNNRSGFVLPHNSKIFPKGSRILPLFLISQSLSKQKELERSKSNESHTSINTSTQINNETPLMIRNPQNSMIDREKIMASGEVHNENTNLKPVIQGNEYRGAGETSTKTSNEDFMLEMTTEKLVNSKIVSKNDETNDCHDDNDVGPTLEFRINVPVHLRIAKDRNGNGFNLKSIDLGKSKKKMKNDDHDQNLFDENSDQDWFRDYSESERTEKNIVEKAVKHTDKPFSLVKFVSNLFHSDPNSKKKSSMDDYEDEDVIVEQELFGKNGLFDVDETTSRKTRIGGSFWINHDPDYNMNSQHAGDKFASKNSRNTEETPIERGETAGEESFESARVIMPLWGETRMPKDGSGLWNANGLTVQDGQQILEGLNDSKFPQKASLIEFQPFFDSIMDDGDENYFPPRGVLSFM